MHLRHIHIPGLSQHTSVSRLQEQLARQHLDWKASQLNIRPPPFVITAQFHPVYTCGRREVGTVTKEQQEYLRADGKAEFHEALRGGQTTFHGPGQLVAYPIIDLKRHALSPRCYVHLLEEVTMKTCAQYNIATQRTDNPGVWVDQDRKICAVGIHLRRNTSSHGISLNVDTDLWWFNRIVACGLEGKSAVNFEEMGVHGKTWEQAGEVFVDQLSRSLHGVEGVAREKIEMLPDKP